MSSRLVPTAPELTTGLAGLRLPASPAHSLLSRLPRGHESAPCAGGQHQEPESPGALPLRPSPAPPAPHSHLISHRPLAPETLRMPCGTAGNRGEPKTVGSQQRDHQVLSLPTPHPRWRKRDFPITDGFSVPVRWRFSSFLCPPPHSSCCLLLRVDTLNLMSLDCDPITSPFSHHSSPSRQSLCHLEGVSSSFVIVLSATTPVTTGDFSVRVDDSCSPPGQPSASL